MTPYNKEEITWEYLSNITIERRRQEGNELIESMCFCKMFKDPFGNSVIEFMNKKERLYLWPDYYGITWRIWGSKPSDEESNNAAWDLDKIRVMFDVLDVLSSSYDGKQIYFMQDDGLIYSRYSCKYMTINKAVDEFANRLLVLNEG